MNERTKGTDSSFSKRVADQNKKAAKKASKIAKKAADQKLNRVGTNIVFDDDAI